MSAMKPFPEHDPDPGDATDYDPAQEISDDPYELDDPKSDDYHDRMAWLYDNREGK